MKMKTIGDVATTSDCLLILNEYKQAKWKRKSKFKIKCNPDDEDYDSEVRIFSDGTETVSILSSMDHTYLMFIDLSLSRDLIARIQSLAKKFYTHDYGEVFLNPWENKLWVVGGDGGMMYSEESPEEIIKRMEEGDYGEGDDELLFGKFIPEIVSTEFEAEYFPPSEESELEDEPSSWNNETELRWILVGKCNDICNFENY